jgi:23S rRNA pseudouridine1911/1915/1917 synthase
MQKNYCFFVTDEESGLRIDRFLTKKALSLSRSLIQKLILSGAITVNSKKRKPHYLLKADDQIDVTVPPPQPLEVEKENIPIDIVYEDRSLMLINKRPGMVVHPAAGNRTGTLVNALLFHCNDLSGIGGVERPGIVHRLDKGTSGLLLVAKDDMTHQSLSKQFKERSMKKEYLVLVKGEVKNQKGRIETLIGRDPFHRKKMAVLKENGRTAVTDYSVKERFAGFTLLEIGLKTGRTHQIRVHMAHIKHPVVGDAIYGRKLIISKKRSELEEALLSFNRQALHAFRLGFAHPVQKKYMEFEALPPSDMQKIIEVLRRETKE